MIRAHFFKLFRSPFLYLGFAGVVALLLYSLNGRHFGNAFINLEILLDLESFRRMYVFFAAVPFAASFADEWNSRAITGCVTRKNVVKYSVSTVAVCFLSAFAVVFIALLIYVCVTTSSLPLYDTQNEIGTPYEKLFYSGAGFMPFLFMIFVFALSCGMWAVMGLMMSAFFPSRYVAICSPFVFCYVIERLTRNSTEYFDLYALSRSATSRGAAFFMPWASAVFIAITIICGFIFTLTVKRRVENGLN